MEENQKKYKLILFALIGVAALLLLFAAMNVIEDRIEKYEVYEADDDDDWGDDEDEEIELEKGQILVNGNIYTYNAAVRNYLIIGTDASGSGAEPSENKSDYHGAMADVLMLLVLNRADNTYAILEIDRNTVMDVPMMNADGTVNASSIMQICTSHWFGGTPEMNSKNTVNAVSQLLGGMNIDGYYELNMNSIEKLNHAIGGVPVTVKDDFSNTDPSLVVGETITLNDEQAFHYVHDRLEVGDGSNEERMERQEEYIKAFWEKLRNETKKNQKLPNEIFDEMQSDVETDMTGNDLSRVINRTNNGTNLGIISFEGEHKIGQIINDGKDHQEFYIDSDSYYEVMNKLFDLELVKSK